MDGFNTVKEICGKISASANQIAEYEESIKQLENHGEKTAADLFAEVQEFSLEQLQSLTLLLTGILVPGQEEEFEENLDEADGGVFMPGELDANKPPVEVIYPGENESEDDE